MTLCFLLGLAICRYLSKKQDRRQRYHEERRRREVSDRYEPKLHCAIRIRIPEHPQDHDRWKSISRWDWKLGTAAHLGEEARGHLSRAGFGDHHLARRVREHEEFEAGPMNISKECKYDKSQDIRILLETAHPVRGHKEVRPMNSSPRANATKARTLGGILLDAAGFKLANPPVLRRRHAMKFEKAAGARKEAQE
ncbi:hypothetical protein B0H13DRAFT_2285158 [Mycena leptocephala]|nr:hypothetical protein B0H13DRAFT_2285158 [Mycena leptocephala]